MKRHLAKEQKLPSSSEGPPHRAKGLFYACSAVLLFGTNPIFVRWSTPLNAIEIAFWRLTIAAILVAVLGICTKQQLTLNRKVLPRFLLYGLITALHFLFYIAALSFTTIAHALSLTYTSPIFVTLFSILLLREPLPRRKYVGIGIAVIGIAILTGFEPNYTVCSLHGQCMLLGDGLALLSGICFGVYSVMGRGERARYPLFQYTTNVYGLAALWLLLPTTFFLFTHSYPLLAIGSVMALGIFPLGLGHTLYNAAVRNVHATYANLIATQEVTLGVLSGVIFLHEIPTLTTIIGGCITLLGIVGVLI